MKSINYAGRLTGKPLTKKQRNDYIREHFDIPSLRKAGFFINGERSFDEIEQRILTFFAYKDIREFSQHDENGSGHISLGGTESAYVNRGIIQ